MKPRGFTLPEILVTVLLVALLATGLAALLGGGLSALFGSRSSGVCLQLAQQQMEAFLVAPQATLQPQAGQFSGAFSRYAWTLATRPSSGVLCLTVTVRGGPGQTATLTAYRRLSGGSMVFTRADGNATSQVWLCAADGSGLKQLTQGPSLNRTPTLSPDGTRVAFVSNRTRTRASKSSPWTCRAARWCR